MNQPSILVIDDEPANFDVIEALLSSELYNLHYASNGTEAINSLDLFQPDVILLDVMMPELNGIQVCQQIKSVERWSVLPIIMITALSSKVDLAQCLQAGADDFINKPINGLELRSRVKSMLRIKHNYDALQKAEAEKLELLENRNTQLEQEILERTAILNVTLERESLVNKIALQMLSSLNLQELLNTTVQEIRTLLYCHSVAIWQLMADRTTRTVAESTKATSCEYLTPTFADEWLEFPWENKVQVITDIYRNNLSKRQRDFLENLQVKAKILVPILQGEKIWGWLNAIESSTVREWEKEEVLLLEQLATQVSIAIGKATAYQQLQTELQDRKIAEIHLRQSENRYSSLAAALPVGVYRTDAQGDCIYVNQCFCTMTGLNEAEVLGGGWVKILHADDRQSVTDEWYRSVKEKRSFNLEYRYQRPDGHITWVFGQSVPEYDDAGKITGYVGTVTDITERKNAQEMVMHNSLHDLLTDLPNRTLLMERLELAINRSKLLTHYQYAVLFLDLDRFKVINDSLGHLAGDQILKNIAHILKTHLKSVDLISRLGSDEFVILLENVSGLEEVIKIVQRIQKDCKSPIILNDYEMSVTISIGIVLGTPNYAEAGDLLRDADIAMYRAKTESKGNYKVFDSEMHIQAVNRMILETELQKALERDEFMVYYQPIIDIVRDKLMGFEVLLRWQHPTRGFIAPSEFIPITEETGLIVQIDSWVFQQACQQIAIWKTKFALSFPLKISINLSVKDLVKDNLIEEIDRIIAQTGITGECITLEITESMLIENITKTINILNTLKARKIQISIDDFGTGYSSLKYLHLLPADYLKIDYSFVSQMVEGNRNYQVVNTIITLSNQLGLAVVAEGIETAQQLHWLQQLGCELGQGYLFSKALPASEIETRFLQNHHQKFCQDYSVYNNISNNT